MCGNGRFALQWQISDIGGRNIYDGEIQNTTSSACEIIIPNLSKCVPLFLLKCETTKTMKAPSFLAALTALYLVTYPCVGESVSH